MISHPRKLLFSQPEKTCSKICKSCLNAPEKNSRGKKSRFQKVKEKTQSQAKNSTFRHFFDKLKKWRKQ